MLELKNILNIFVKTKQKNLKLYSYIFYIRQNEDWRKRERLQETKYCTGPSRSPFRPELSLGKGPWLNAISVKASNPATRVKIPTRRAPTGGTYAALGFRCLLWWLHYLSKYLPNVTRRLTNGQCQLFHVGCAIEPHSWGILQIDPEKLSSRFSHIAWFWSKIYCALLTGFMCIWTHP